MLNDDFTCIDVEADNLQIYDMNPSDVEEEPVVFPQEAQPPQTAGLRVSCVYGCGEFDLEELNFTLRHGLVIAFRCPVCNEFQKTDMVIRS